MKFLSVEITWVFIIGVASLIIALSILFFWREKIPDILYCTFFRKIFQTEELNSKCKEEIETIVSVEIFSTNERDIINQFTSYLLKCWIDAEKYKNFNTHYCFKISFRTNFNFKLYPQNISEALKAYDNCRILQYEIFNCGYRNDIIWKVEKNFISNEDIVIIKYLDTHKIEIIS